MNNHKKSIVYSTNKAINKAKITGILNLKDINIYQVLNSTLDIFKNISTQSLKYKKIESNLRTLVNNSDTICNIKSVLPKGSYIVDNNNNVIITENGVTPPIVQFPVVITDLNVSNLINEQILNNIPETADFYKFNISDFLSVYNDNSDQDFRNIVIFREDLDGGVIRRLYDVPNLFGDLYTQKPNSYIVIQKDDIPNWAYYNTSTTDFNHSLKFIIVDLQPVGAVSSNQAFININRSGSENQPASIGDITLIKDNRSITILTLDMFTSQLTPPYNDPENDLIDAIRIDEISTANLGILKLNNIVVTEGTIITREQLANNEFTYEGPDIDSIHGDSFNFSARDEGSKIWVK